MAAIKITQDMSAADLRRLARCEKSGRVAARLFAIANILSGMSRSMAAQLAGMERQVLRDWVHRFNAEGVDGLRDRKHTGRPSTLDAVGLKKLAERVEKGADLAVDGLVRWRRIDLKEWLAKECHVTYDETSIGRILRKMGFSHLTPRPVHPEGDPEAQEDFKKTLLPKLQGFFLNQPKTKTSNFGSRMKRGLDKKVL